MNRYVVTAKLTISVSTFVEAKTEAEAKRRALERTVQGLCHHCASADSGHQWVTDGELDGVPRQPGVEPLELPGEESK